MATAHPRVFVVWWEERVRCGPAGEAGLLLIAEVSPFLAPLATALILLLMGPRGGLSQGWSRHYPPCLPRVLRNPCQPSPVEAFSN